MSNQFVDCGSFQNTDFKWTHSANWLLINNYLDLREEFRDPSNRRKDLWTRIAEKFRENGYEISPELLDKKFRNLRATYYQIKERKRNSANKQIKWEYFKVFEDLLQEEDATTEIIVSPHTAVPVPAEDPRLSNFRSSVYVPLDGRKRTHALSKSKATKETTKIVNIEPVVDGLDDDIIDESEKPSMNGFKDLMTTIDDTIVEDSQDDMYDDDYEDYDDDDISGNFDAPSMSKKANISSLEAKKIQAETRYYNKKADYFEKQTVCLDVQKKLMVLQAHKLKLEIDKMKNEKRSDAFAT